MYRIVQLEDGTCECHLRVQDGSEDWAEPNLDAAIKSMILYAKTANNDKIRKRDITFWRPERVIREETRLVQFKP